MATFPAKKSQRNCQINVPRIKIWQKTGRNNKLKKTNLNKTIEKHENKQIIKIWKKRPWSSPPSLLGPGTPLRRCGSLRGFWQKKYHVISLYWCRFWSIFLFGTVFSVLFPRFFCVVRLFPHFFRQFFFRPPFFRTFFGVCSFVFWQFKAIVSWILLKYYYWIQNFTFNSSLHN